MNEQPNQQKTGSFSKLTAWILGITGVLVLVPALINAMFDVYASIQNLPRTEAEKVNMELFEKYHGAAPLFSRTIPVRTHLGTISMLFEVHEGGDIFVRYGENSQWFRFPLAATNSAWLIRNAHAQDWDGSVPQGNFYQYDSMHGRSMQRELFFEDGKKQTFLIDPRTGIWNAPVAGEYETRPKGAIPNLRTYELPVIDLTRPRAQINVPDIR